MIIVDTFGKNIFIGIFLILGMVVSYVIIFGTAIDKIIEEAD